MEMIRCREMGKCWRLLEVLWMVGERQRFVLRIVKIFLHDERVFFVV